MSETATDPTRTLDAIIEIAPAALETVLGIRADEEDPDGLGLRIEITGTSGVDFTYDLAFDELANAVETDEVFDAGGISVIVPADSVDRLRGSVLDVPRSTGQGGLVIRNPNRPNPLEGVELDLEGSVADRVQQLLDQSINPSLASHGGFATLVGVDDDNAVYLTMGGGCQGCAMSRMTLTEGIDRAIREAIPEVTNVIDATDHGAGENPFYT
jgi:Fe/S biogenesis protein NfuA